MENLTYGQKLVGLNFNPGGDEAVTNVKTFYAKVIDGMNALKGDGQATISVEKALIIDEAIRQAMTAQMWAVKAITWKS